MTIATISSSEEDSQYVGLVYEEHYTKLRHYFLMLLGNASEAEACLQETFRHFFFFMEDRCWATDVEYMPVYIMRIAGSICSRKLAARERQSKLDKFRNSVIQAIKELKKLKQLFLIVKGNSWQPRLKHVASLRRAQVASM